MEALYTPSYDGVPLDIISHETDLAMRIVQHVPTIGRGAQLDDRGRGARTDRLVVKTTGGAGGYGMLMGPFASRSEIDAYAEQMRSNPAGYIAQPLVKLSAHGTWIDSAGPREVTTRAVESGPRVASNATKPRSSTRRPISNPCARRSSMMASASWRGSTPTRR